MCVRKIDVKLCEYYVAFFLFYYGLDAWSPFPVLSAVAPALFRSPFTSLLISLSPLSSIYEGAKAVRMVVRV